MRAFLLVAAAALATTPAPAQNEPLYGLDKYADTPALGPVTDDDPALLRPPDSIAGSDVFTVAAAPPRTTLTTLTGLPTLTEETGGLWTSWGEGLLASNGKLYVGVGDHRGMDGRCYLYEYDPSTHEYRCVLNMVGLIGQEPGDWGHGKLHGRLDEMPDGWIYFATYWGGHPDHVKPEELVKIGGRLVRYNVRTGAAEDLGMPKPGDSFPMHATDVRRGVFHAIGLYGGYLAWDIEKRRPIFCGPFPEGYSWDIRVTLIDPVTGFCYGSENPPEAAAHGGCAPGAYRIFGYDPADNRFFTTKASVPPHPQIELEQKPDIRCYTRGRLPDGSFICQTHEGVMFKFFPDAQRCDLIGLNWVEGLYSTAIATSPKGRYIYYAVGAHGKTWQYGGPIIQMDTRTYQKKVIAFLHPFFLEKYGYTFGGSYTMGITPDGSRLVSFWNGRFREKQEGDSFGHLAFLCIDIPESERRE